MNARERLRRKITGKAAVTKADAKQSCVKCGKPTTCIHDVTQQRACRVCQKDNPELAVITDRDAKIEFAAEEAVLVKLRHHEKEAAAGGASGSKKPIRIYLRNEVEAAMIERYGSREKLERIAQQKKINAGLGSDRRSSTTSSSNQRGVGGPSSSSSKRSGKSVSDSEDPGSKSSGSSTPIRKRQRSGSATSGTSASKKKPSVIKFASAKSISYGFLSTLSLHPIELQGKKWPSVEHYFQAQKFIGKPLAEILRTKEDPVQVKRIGESDDYPPREDWPDIRDEVMYEALLAKFTQHSDLRKKLVDTDDVPLVHHTKADSYWGDGPDGLGENMLGKTLMIVRTKFQREAELGATPTSSSRSAKRQRRRRHRDEEDGSEDEEYSEDEEGGGRRKGKAKEKEDEKKKVVLTTWDISEVL